MSKLTSKVRAALPASSFALPGRKYPIQDHSHQVNALARASQQFNRGAISAATEKKIDAAAHRALKK